MKDAREVAVIVGGCVACCAAPIAAAAGIAVAPVAALGVGVAAVGLAVATRRRDPRPGSAVPPSQQ